MFMVRLISLGALALAGLHLRKRLQHQGDKQKKVQDGPPETLEDILIEDPVCKCLIPQKQAFVLKQESATFYFCSESCRKLFQTQPEKRA